MSRHELIGHTADAGFRATARDLPALFREAAAALTGLTARVERGVRPSVWHDVAVEADDIEELAYAWLNELIALTDISDGALVEARIERLEHQGSGDGGPGSAWSLRGRVGIVPFDDEGVEVLGQPKAATYHGLRVEQREDGWTLVAYVDL